MTGTQTLVAAGTPGRPEGRRGNRLLLSGVVAGPLFVGTFLVEGALRAGYDPVRHPVSSLELGAAGWVQVVNFLVAGVLTLVFAVGLRRSLQPGRESITQPERESVAGPGRESVAGPGRESVAGPRRESVAGPGRESVAGPGRGSVAGPGLIAVWGVGLLGAGVFASDPVSGFPVGTPPQQDPPTWHGFVHDMVFSVPGFGCLAAAMLVLAYAFARRRSPGWAVYSAVSGVAFIVLFYLAGEGFSQDPRWVSTAGLLQRLTVGVGWLWLTLLALRQKMVLDRLGGG